MRRNQGNPPLFPKQRDDLENLPREQQAISSRILGIVAEYDPFHQGHLRHLRMAREQVLPDFTWVVLSGCWKQRGELAMLSPFDRARCALEAGADAVFLLPAAWTVRDAEHYALGAISLLAGLGATHLAFGAETDQRDTLMEAAGLLEQPTEAFSRKLRQGMERGWGYPKALAWAAGEIQPALRGVMESPNNILGISYLRAIARLKAGMEPVLISRNGSYHAERIHAEAPSASAIRAAVRRGSFQDAFSAVPPYTRQVIRDEMLEQRIPNPDRLDPLLIHRLRSMTAAEIKALPDASEGLEERILRAARVSQTREQLLDSVCTSRYPRARISRICAWSLLGATGAELSKMTLPGETVLLGLKKNAEMTAQWKRSAIRIFSSMKETEGSPLWQADRVGWNLWNLCAGLPMDDFCRQKMLIYPENA